MKKHWIILTILPVFLMGFALGNKHTGMIKNQKMTQVGIIVEDVEMASRAWASMLGMEEVPGWSIAEGHESRPTEYLGEPSQATAKLAFFQLDNITIELIEPMKGPSTWKTFLEEHGPGIHHIAFQVDDMKSAVQRFEKGGIKEEQHGGWGTGEYAYIDGKASIGAIVELLENYKD